MSELGAPALSSSVDEICGVFTTRSAMQEAIAQLALAGFDRADISLPLEGAAAAAPEAGADNPDTPTDQRQIRTMQTSMAGAVGALAAAGVTIATGGAAAVAMGAAIAAGAGAGLLTNAVTSPSEGPQGAGDATAGHRFLLTVRTGSSAREARAQDVMQRSGAENVSRFHRQQADQGRT